METLKLYAYFRSSSSYRVRIGLNLKGLPYEIHPVHLLKNGGEQRQASYRQFNPMGEVPCLEHQGFYLSQSMAIFDYLEQIQPQPSLFPSNPHLRAKTIEVCEVVNSGIQPLQNLKVLQALEAKFHLDNGGKAEWSAHWIQEGFTSLENILQKYVGTYCFGDEVTAADAFLVPQVYNARRFNVDMKAFPTLSRINDNCLKLKAFQDAQPEAQPDFA